MTRNKSDTPEYRIWSSMKDRCTRPTAKDFARYGGRGITVCDDWLKFDRFLADMGPRPSDQHSLERINNSLGYGAGNCRWATLIEQANNKRTNRFVEYRGQRMTVASAVRTAGNLVLRETALCRIRNGWQVADAVETPNTFRRAQDRTKIRTATAE